MKLGGSPELLSPSQTASGTTVKDFGLLLRASIAFAAAFLISVLIIHSPVIALPYAVMIAGLPLYFHKRKQEKLRAELRSLWPEILDHVISGLRSGLSLSETLSALGQRGPEATERFFLNFENELKGGLTFEIAISNIKKCFNDPIADQVCEVLKFARGSGSRDTSLTLRTLADFIRSDLDLRNEIAAKHGWIKNSAALAALAPWVLLLILALQPNTLKAYTSPSGSAVLMIGALMTIVAYLWMNRVGRIPENPRVFIK